jgi:sugar phosphate isomerase/epimerase
LALAVLGVGRPAPAAPPSAAAGDKAAVGAHPFYVYCLGHGVRGVKPRPVAEDAAIFRDVGFDGAGYPLWFGDELDKNLRVLDQAGLKLYMLYMTIDLKNTARPYDPRVAESIAKLKGRPVTICVLIIGRPAGDPAGMEAGVKILRRLGDLAAQAGVRISIYNHVGNWTESLAFALEVVKNTGHPAVGANFNLCHWLKVDGGKDYRPLLRANAAKIFAVTISGAQPDSKNWPGGMIQPLDRGDFDNRALLTTLDAAGYRGPVGLMCFGVGGDPREHLGRSMKVWKTWQTAGAK